MYSFMSTDGQLKGILNGRELYHNRCYMVRTICTNFKLLSKRFCAECWMVVDEAGALSIFFPFTVFQYDKFSFSFFSAYQCLVYFQALSLSFSICIFYVQSTFHLPLCMM